MTIQIQDEKAQVLALIQFSWRFSGLVEAGISLVRSLLLLEDIGGAYGEAAHDIRLGVEAGYTLSHQMSLRPDLFSPFYVGAVRVGEIGGVLELTLRRSADIIGKECRLLSRIPEASLLINAPAGQTIEDDWTQMSEYKRNIVQLLFCEAFGSLLSYGVPILRTLELMKSLVPAKQRGNMTLMYASVKNGEPIDIGRLGILSPFVVSLIQFGEEHDLLDRALLKAAEIIENELDAYWSLVAA